MARYLILFFFAALPHINSAFQLEYEQFGRFSPLTTGVQRNSIAAVSSVYYVSTTTSSWGDAWFSCQQAFNGQLLTVETTAENDYIRDLMLKDGRSIVWTSGAYDGFSGVWRWASNMQEITNAQWSPTEPSSASDNSRIVIVNALFNRYWAVNDLTASRHSICEVSEASTATTTPPPTTPLAPGTEPPMCDV